MVRHKPHPLKQSTCDREGLPRGIPHMYMYWLCMCLLHHVGTPAGPNVCKVQLRTSEILSRLQSSAGTVDPVTVENCCVNSIVTKISINGLHQNATHISILGMQFNVSDHSLQQILTQVKSIKFFTQSQPMGTIDCTWNPTTRKLMAVVTEFLSHVKIFYSRTPYVEFWVELCNVKLTPSTACDIPHPAFTIRPPQSFMTALYDNSYNLPNVSVATIRDESPDMNATLDDGSTSDSDSMIETSEVAYEDGCLRIQLNSALLYSIIKERSVGAPYPEAFKATQTVNDCKFSILLKIFPFKSRSEHISVWAEVTAPPHARGQGTLQVTAFNPQKEQRLGYTVECTEKLKYSDAGDCKKAHFTLDDVMLHMFAFYLIHGVELCVSISYHY